MGIRSGTPGWAGLGGMWELPDGKGKVRSPQGTGCVLSRAFPELGIQKFQMGPLPRWENIVDESEVSGAVSLGRCAYKGRLVNWVLVTSRAVGSTVTWVPGPSASSVIWGRSHSLAVSAPSSVRDGSGWEDR